jgi:hypothetical protein
MRLLLAISLCLLVAACGQRPGASTETGKGTASSEAAKDPWPECAEARKWLLENTGEPDKLEVVAWQARNLGPGADQVTLIVKVREATRFGGREVRQKAVTVKKQ